MKEEKLPIWMAGFEKEKLEKSAEIGEVLTKVDIPDILPNKNQGEPVKLSVMEKEPRMIESDKFKFGKTAFVLKVKDENGIEKSLWLPNSLRFKIGVIFRRKGDLKGLKIAVWKERANLEEWGESIVYNVNILEE